mgnify:CR=1 FL=1
MNLQDQQLLIVQEAEVGMVENVSVLETWFGAETNALKIDAPQDTAGMDILVFAKIQLLIVRMVILGTDHNAQDSLHNPYVQLELP